MRLLLDECVDERVRLWFVKHECQTARYAGLAGLKNGALLAAAEEAGFDVLVTTDQGIPHHQAVSLGRIAILVLRGETNRRADLQRLLPAALQALEGLLPGQAIVVE